MIRRLLILVLDGATWSVAEPLIERGRMPELARLRGGGRWGVLHSTSPPLTPAAFGSMFTGLGPGRHGVFDFFGHGRGDFLSRPPTSAADLAAPTVWEWLAAAGWKVGLAHLPMTWPAPTGARFVVSSQPGARGVLPQALGGELEDVAPGHLLPARARWRRAAAMARAERRRQEAALHLARTQPWEVLGVGVKSTDAIAHGAWAAHDPTHPGHRPGSGDPLVEEYQRADRLLGELRACAPDAAVLVLSDHGHGPCHHSFGINRWLLEAGFLAVERRCRRVVESALRYRLFRARCRSGWDCFVRLVDWSRTRAYSGTGTEQGIYLNLQGREPRGVIRPGAEASATLDEIEAALAPVALPSGQPFGRCGARRRERIAGPYAWRAPDLLLEIDGGRVLAREGLRPGPLFRPTPGTSGTHRPEGIFVAGGPGISAAGRPLRVLRVEDVAPTIAALCGVAVPGGLDGRSALRLWESSGETTAPIAARPKARDSCESGGASDTRRVREELRSWGYLED